MTRLYRIFRSNGILCAVVLFLALELWCFSNNHLRLLVILLAGMTIFPLGFIFHYKKSIVWFAYPYFLILLVCQVFSALLGINLAYVFFLTNLFILPIIAVHYFVKIRPRYIHGAGSIATMFLGFIISVIYHFAINHGSYDYSLGNDSMTFIAFSVFFSGYLFLALGYISIRYVMMALALSILPITMYLSFHIIELNGLHGLLVTRFGTDILNADFISELLDFGFPIALFFALGEKRLSLKIVFSLLSVFYCFCILSTWARGSLPGLAAIPLFFIIKSRSILVWITVAILSLGAMGLLGGRVTHRLLAPSRADYVSDWGRLTLLKSANLILKDNYYFFGIGMDNFASEKFKYGFPISFDQTKVFSVHNTHVEIWLGWGLLGLIGWLVLLVGTIVRTIRTQLPSELQHLKYGCVFSLSSFAVHGIFDCNLGRFTFLIFPFTILACMSFLIRQDMRNSLHPSIK